MKIVSSKRFVRNTLVGLVIGCGASLMLVVEANASITTVHPNTIGRLCPDWVEGDRDFVGHGPRVYVSTALTVNSIGTALVAYVTFTARETQADWTTARGEWSLQVWRAPYGHKINRVVSPLGSEAIYVDNNHELDVLIPRSVAGIEHFPNKYPNQVGPVAKYYVMGDTKGKDVGRCSWNDTYVQIEFRKDVKIDLERR